MINTVKVKINNKWELILPEHRARPDWNTWEFERLKSMSENLGSDDRIVYIGAEEGDMCALCSMWGADIVMIEPNDKVWPNIGLVWNENKLPTPETFNGFASSDTTVGARIQHGFPESVNGEVIGNHGFKTLIEYPEIQRIKIDDIDGKITALSVDVEGAEYEVIKGAVETMKTQKPKIWLSLHPEFMWENYRVYGNDLRNFIKSFGYSETLLAYEHEVHFFYK